MEKYKYYAVMFTRYLGDSLYYPFISLYLSYRGLIDSKIGLILSITPLIGMVMNPIFTKICKNLKITKNLLMIITILEAVFINVIGFASGFVPLTICTVMIAVFGSSHYGLMDSIVTVYAWKNNKSYSSIRIFGGISYVLGTALGGLLIKYLGYSWCFITASSLFVITGIIYHLMLPVDNEEEDKESEAESKKQYRDIFKNKHFIFFLISYVMYYTLCFSSDHFFPLFLESKGFDASNIGAVYSYYVLTEVILMFILSRFKDRLNGDILLIISFITMLLRQTINYLDPSSMVVIIASGLRGISIAIFFHVSYTYCLKLVGKTLTTTGIMLMNLGQLLGLFIMDNVSGNIVESYGYKVFYLVMMISTLSLVVIQITRYLFLKRQKDIINI